MLSADQLTVAASEALKASHNHSLSDLVFYLDLVDNLNHHDNQDLSIHSKIHTFHHLLYSSKEVVYAPDGLWFLCASWTETLSTKSMDEDTPCSNSTNSTTANSTDPINSSTNQQRKSTCSQNLYFNTNFLIESRQIEDMNELQELPHSALSNLDHSGMLQLQYMHLQSIVSRILNFRTELNDQYRDEIDMYDNIVSHKLTAETYLAHTNKLRESLDKTMSDREKNGVDITDLKDKLKKMSSFLEEQDAVANAHADRLKKYRMSEVNIPMKKLEMMRIAIVDANSQAQRLRFGIDSSDDIMQSLNHEVKTVSSYQTDRASPSP